MKRATGLGASAAKSAANASGSTAGKPSPTGPTLLAAAGILSLRSATLSPTSGSKAATEKRALTPGCVPTSLMIIPPWLWATSTEGLPSDCHPDCIIVLEAVRTSSGEIEPRTRRWKNASPCLTQKTPYKGLGAESEEKREPVSDIDTGVVDSLKVLDPDRPI